MSNNANNTMKHSETTPQTSFDSQQLTSNDEMSWTTYTVYNFADDLHWPELGMLLESIDYHESAKKASFLGSMSEDPLMPTVHFEGRFDEWWNMLITVRNILLVRSKISFIESNFKLEVVAITW